MGLKGNSMHRHTVPCVAIEPIPSVRCLTTAPVSALIVTNCWARLCSVWSDDQSDAPISSIEPFCRPSDRVSLLNLTQLRCEQWQHLVRRPSPLWSNARFDTASDTLGRVCTGVWCDAPQGPVRRLSLMPLKPFL